MFAIFFIGKDVVAWHSDAENMESTTISYDLVNELPEVLANTPAGYGVKRGSEGVYELYELPKPEPTPTDKIATLEYESAILALELVDTQARLQQSQADHAALLLELVDKGVI
jgi:hypothetical protein